MRKFLHVALLATISFAATTVVAPRAHALPEEGLEIYYYNYGSQFPDGQDVSTCGGQYWITGDTTPTQIGELKVEIYTYCPTYSQSYQWYRWGFIECAGPM